MFIFNLFNIEIAAIKLKARNKFLQTCYCQGVRSLLKQRPLIIYPYNLRHLSQEQETNFYKLATDKGVRSEIQTFNNLSLQLAAFELGADHF